jgi:hypothetical protein
MQEKQFVLPFRAPGTTAANVLFYVEMPFPWTLLGIKAVAQNDSDATLAASGGATIAAAVIGDDGDPVYLEPTSVQRVAKDELVILTLDYDGSAGTAAQNVDLQLIGLSGEG